MHYWEKAGYSRSYRDVAEEVKEKVKGKIPYIDEDGLEMTVGRLIEEVMVEFGRENGEERKHDTILKHKEAETIQKVAQRAVQFYKRNPLFRPHPDPLSNYKS